MARRYRNNDPFWMTLKYNSRPNSKGEFVPKGTRVFFYPATGAVLTGEAAEQASRDFEAAKFDEQGF